MSRKHTLVVAIALGLAVLMGALALTRTAGRGASSKPPRVSNAVIAQRARQLDRFQASLQRELAKRPPALPVANMPAPSSGAQRVVYVRPKPIIIHKHRAGGEYEAEGHDGGGSDD